MHDLSQTELSQVAGGNRQPPSFLLPPSRDVPERAQPGYPAAGVPPRISPAP